MPIAISEPSSRAIVSADFADLHARLITQDLQATGAHLLFSPFKKITNPSVLLNPLSIPPNDASACTSRVNLFSAPNLPYFISNGVFIANSTSLVHL